ncbi:MAG: hypothetical protein H6978_15050 [Gammaproteobacteria bacterium]|nr:hypothetical protein [Gammaproteobacteria bacterium]
MQNIRNRTLANVIMLVSMAISQAHLIARAAEPAPRPHQFTFAWPYTDADKMKPRGGTTRGEDITLAEVPSAQWLALQQAGISSFERDRRAILAMAGGFRASFDFLEVADFSGKPDYQPPRPYQSWGTEKVYVVEDSGDFISLQHVLVMRVRMPDGKLSEPFINKHWRQDWQFEPADYAVYQGADTWQTHQIPGDQRRGSWKQTVYQVDDSPRYAAVGQWQHSGNYSTWIGGETWRPLPRREYAVRDDYQVLVGTNRHTITPNGWIHEELNNKVAIAGPGQLRADQPVLAREFGFNRYERITGFDFSPGDSYVEKTEPMWKIVRDEWQVLLATGEPVTMRGAADKDELFVPLYDMANQIERGDISAKQMARDDWQDSVRSAVRSYLK